MSNRLVIIGAGGHGKVVADIALKNGYSDICFVDDNASCKCMGFSIAGKCEELSSFDDGQTDFIIAIGNNYIREKISKAYDVPWTTLIHPSAQIGENVQIGKGTVVMANAVINVCAQIGLHCIVNSGSVVEHDNILEDYVHICPKAALGGDVNIGKLTQIGIGATVINQIDICECCMVGAGAVVVKSINESGTYVGVPAGRILR